MTDGFNRLARSKSPYLLQHSTQPVWWWEWCDEAFARARQADLPLFVSIGYSSCHWCHVMSRESFEDPDVAACLNRHFISVKVDREEYPHIDDRFMAVCQLQTGSGGWPLSIFLTPEGLPFYAATYLPRFPRSGMPGIIEVLERIARAWHEQRSLVQRNASLLSGGLARHFEPDAGKPPASGEFVTAWESLRLTLDAQWGGFALAPKFPTPYKLRFLMRVFLRLSDRRSLDALETTLGSMMRGGIRDQIGGGYHRYAMDREWNIPHFEKMLYDQALLTQVFCEASLLTGNGGYLSEAGSIVRYVIQNLRSGDGLFHAAEDADSEGEEGKFYLWARREILELLGNPDGAVAADALGIPSNGGMDERFVPRLASPEEICRRHGISPAELEERMPLWISTLATLRDRRARPFRDSKVVTEWNGLMIAALALYASLTGNESIRESAREAFGQLMELERKAGGLMRCWYDGTGTIPALLDDYAALIGAALELHHDTLDTRYIDEAVRLIETVEQSFFRGDGTLFRSRDGVAGELGPLDSIIPPPVSLLAEGYARLWRLTDSDRYRRAGESLYERFGGTIHRKPVSCLCMLLAWEYYDPGAPTIFLPPGAAGQPEERRRYRSLALLPGAVWRISSEESGELCTGRMCLGRFTDPAGLGILLQKSLQAPQGAAKGDDNLE